MPRETVKDTNQLYDIQVGWSVGTVQLGLETDDFPSLLNALQANYDDSSKAKSIWASMDRDGINRLIRLLRKARDSAYGADA
jgi:hypothetical protein